MPATLMTTTSRALLTTRAFDPSMIPGLATWLRADSGVYSGNAAAFTAASTMFLSIADNASLSMGAGVSFTIAGWVWFNGLATVQSIASKSVTTIALAANLGEYIIYKDAADKINFYLSSGAANVTVPSAGTVTAGAWHFVVGRRDGTNVSLRVDANTFVDTASALAAQDSTGSFVLGGTDSAGTTPLDGRLDAWGVWKRALTNAEVDSLYNGGVGLRYGQLDDGLRTTLISWWDLEQPTGNRTDSVTTSANDLASNNSVGIADGIAITPAVDGDAVRQWNGGTGGVNATQSATPASRPLYKTAIVNGKPVIRNDGTDDWLSLTIAALAAQTMIVVTKKRSAPAVGNAALLNWGTAVGDRIITSTGTDATQWFFTGPAQVLTGGTAQNWNILTCDFASLTSLALFVNGSIVTTIDPIDSYASATTLVLGARDTVSAEPSDTDIAELLIYNRALGLAERLTMERYLGTKYGIVTA